MEERVWKMVLFAFIFVSRCSSESCSASLNWVWRVSKLVLSEEKEAGNAGGIPPAMRAGVLWVMNVFADSMRAERDAQLLFPACW